MKLSGISLFILKKNKILNFHHFLLDPGAGLTTLEIIQKDLKAAPSLTLAVNRQPGFRREDS